MTRSSSWSSAQPSVKRPTAYQDRNRVAAALADLDSAPIEEPLRATLRMLGKLTKQATLPACDMHALLAAQPDPIGRLEVSWRPVAAKDLELVTEHEDLDLLGLAGTHDEHHERQRAWDNEVEERPQLGTETIDQAHGDGAR